MEKNYEALKLILNESLSIFHHMKLLVEDKYQEESISFGNRGILQDLAWLGPQSQAQLLDLRPLSRLHIEEMIKPLEESGYVKRMEPANGGKLPMLDITEKGRALIQRSSAREVDILSSVANQMDEKELISALDVLRFIRKSFEGPSSRAESV